MEDKPKGKHTIYNMDGTFASPEGLWDEQGNVSKIHISHYMQKISRE
jgi:hypothetical protein